MAEDIAIALLMERAVFIHYLHGASGLSNRKVSFHPILFEFIFAFTFPFNCSEKIFLADL